MERVVCSRDKVLGYLCETLHPKERFLNRGRLLVPLREEVDLQIYRPCQNRRTPHPGLAATVIGKEEAHLFFVGNDGYSVILLSQHNIAAQMVLYYRDSSNIL